ncbi:uncharacterized protein [Montipora capricornis]|uniref:uncharacterized protein n=1 Tax=Montipora capricornis TaxID=246305 RepID=UPI0035F204E0
MSYSELYASVSGVLDAFTALGLPHQQIQEITNQTKSLISELKEGDDPNKEETKSALGLFTQEISLSTDLHAFVINELEEGHHPHNEEMKIVLDAITALGRSTQQIQDITSQTESPIMLFLCCGLVFLFVAHLFGKLGRDGHGNQNCSYKGGNSTLTIQTGEHSFETPSFKGLRRGRECNTLSTPPHIPGVRFSKVPKSLLARKAISKTAISLFLKSDL